MFGWCFLQFMDLSCQLIPLLVPYLHGVAITCITTVIMGLLHMVMSDNSVTYDDDDVAKHKQEFDHQKSVDDTFSNISVFLMMLHLFWFLFGSINILPVIFIEGMHISRDVLRIHDCDAPVHFWFTFLCLCLQWFLVMVVAIWYKVETNLLGQDYRLNNSNSTEVKNTNQENRQEICQYHSFPKPTLY